VIAAEENGPSADVTYAYRPSVLGATWTFVLRGEVIFWDTGRKSGRIPLRSIRRVRLSFRPLAMQAVRYRAEIWSQGSPKIEFVSSSWKSMVEQERLDGPYRTFLIALHARLAATGATARFEQGVPAAIYWCGLAVFVAVSLAMAALIVRALEAKAWGGAAFIAAFLALFLWQAGVYFRRNRPGHYRADALPADLVPAE